jgi:hypothetical protein
MDGRELGERKKGDAVAREKGGKRGDTCNHKASSVCVWAHLWAGLAAIMAVGNERQTMEGGG